MSTEDDLNILEKFICGVLTTAIISFPGFVQIVDKYTRKISLNMALYVWLLFLATGGVVGLFIF